MAKKRSVVNVQKRAVAADAAGRKQPAKKDSADIGLHGVQAAGWDSFVNFQQKLGIGASGSALSTASYGFNPLTRNRVLLEWIHRGSWLGGMAIDIPAEDMTRAGVEHKGKLKPDEIDELESAATSLGIWQSESGNSICDGLKWGGLYGGAIAVQLIDGQAPETPMRVETVGKDQYKGLLVLDRWMVEPSLNDLVTELGPSLGLPKFYTITADAPALPHMKIHHSRCIRFEGIRLPYYQRLMENLWGISVLERLYDRMVGFDSASTGMAQLVYKSYLRTLSIDKLRQLIGSNKQATENVAKYVNMMTMFQGIEGITVIDAADKFESYTQGSTAMTGLKDAVSQLGEQVSGAMEIPLVRMFGQSPAGLGSDGESALRTYYDGVNHKQNSRLKVGVRTTYELIARSIGVKIPKDYNQVFRPLWQLKEQEKAEIAERISVAITTVADSSVLLPPGSALKELRQQSNITGVWSNISDEDIEAAEKEPVMPNAEDVMSGGEGGGKPNEPDPHASAPGTRVPGAAMPSLRAVK